MHIKKLIKDNVSSEQLEALRVVRNAYRELCDPYPYRRYTKKYKCIFIHVPKAAGTSVLRSLGYHGPRDHCSYREYLKANSTRFAKFFKFSFVRDPYHRFASLYAYFSGGGNGSSSDLVLSKKIQSNNWSIDEFCSFVVRERLFQYDPMFWPQALYLCDAEGNIKVDFIGRVESIDEDFGYVSERIGINHSLLCVNTTERKTVLLSEYAKDVIAEVYSKDFRIFGYDF